MYIYIILYFYFLLCSFCMLWVFVAWCGCSGFSGFLQRAKAEDLRHDGPLAPGVLTPNCHADGPPLLKELNPKFVASASLGQVWVSTFPGRG